MTADKLVNLLSPRDSKCAVSKVMHSA